MRAQPGGVPLRDHRRLSSRLRPLPRRTFLGSDAVAWLVKQGHARTPEEAVALGNRLLDAGLLHHAAYEHRLKDSSGLYYRFTADDAALGAALTAEAAAAASSAAAAGQSAAATAFSPSAAAAVRARSSAGGAAGTTGRIASLAAWNATAPSDGKRAKSAAGRINDDDDASTTTTTSNNASTAALASALAAENARHPHRLLVTAQIAALRQRVAQLEQQQDEALASALAREDAAALAARAAASSACESLRAEGEAVARELGRLARQSAAEAQGLRESVASLRAALAAAGAAVLLLAGGLAALAGGAGGAGAGVAAAAAHTTSSALRLAVPALAAAWAVWSLALTLARTAAGEAAAVATAAPSSAEHQNNNTGLIPALLQKTASVVAAAAGAGDSFDFPGLPAIRTSAGGLLSSSAAAAAAAAPPPRTCSHGGSAFAHATAAALAAALETPRLRARRAASLDAPAPGSPAASAAAAALAAAAAGAEAASSAASPFGAAAAQQQSQLRTVPSASARIQLQASTSLAPNKSAALPLVPPTIQLQPQMTERTAMNTVAAAATAGRTAGFDSTLYAPPKLADFKEGGWRHGPLLVRPHPGVPHMKVLGCTGAPEGSADAREVPAPPAPGDEQARQMALCRPVPRRLGVNGVVIHFETDGFVGKAMLHVRGLPSSDDSLFAAFKRRSHVVVQGRFKRPVGVSEALTGQEFGRPFEKLPAMWLVEHGLLACARRVSTSSAIGGLTTHPYMLLPLLAAAQIANASKPGEEPDMMSAQEDLRLWDPSLVAGHEESASHTAGGAMMPAATTAGGGPLPDGAPLPAEARRKLFTRASARASRTFGTDMVWTFHLWQQFIDMSDYTLSVAGAKYDMARHLAGQPLQFLAKTAGGSHLWAFETWNQRLLERAEQAHRENNK
jgi:hypothetical protein